MNSYMITRATPAEFAEITDVWEASVRATHFFLTKEDILFYKERVPTERLPSLEHLYYLRDKEGKINAFIGVTGQNIDMLFIHPSARGKGLGKKLIFFAIREFGADTVDVNKQNGQAFGFYIKMGFGVVGWNETDNDGKPYPIIHMQLNQALKRVLLSKRPIEKHPLGFYLPEHTKILMLGSFPPPQKRWSMEFYYPNIQNDMWRIIGLVFHQDKNYFVMPGGKAFDKEKAQAFCQMYGVGLGDTAVEVIRMNDDASDKYLEVVEPWDAERTLTKVPECTTIVITGQKAMDAFRDVIPVREPKIGEYADFEFIGRKFRLYRLPSTSRAYPRPLEEKAEMYGKMFKDAGLIG